jgi:hypothetical protein
MRHPSHRRGYVAGGVDLAAASSGGIDSSEPSPTEPEAMKRATYEDVLNAPENKVAEILDGELFLSPMLAPRVGVVHAGLQGAVGRAFAHGEGGPGGWWILSKPEVHLGEHVIVPDIGGWRRQDVPTIPDADYFSIPPSWVCELLAPPTERFDRSRKLRIASSPA